MLLFLLADLIEDFVRDLVQTAAVLEREGELVVRVVGDAVDLAAVHLAVLADADGDHPDAGSARVVGGRDRAATVDVRVAVGDDDGVVLVSGPVAPTRREHVVARHVDAARCVRSAVLQRVRDGVQHARLVRVGVQLEPRLRRVAVRDDAYASPPPVEVQSVDDASGHLLRQGVARLHRTGSVQHEDDVTSSSAS